MSIKPWDKYQPNALIPSPQYPYGALKQETTLGVGNGTPLDVDWGNDFEAFKQTAFSRSGLNPSGAPDTVTNSEMFNAMQDIVSRRIWARISAESGYNLVSGSFEEGGVISQNLDCLWFKKENRIYVWKGITPKNVVPNSTPNSTGGVSASAWVSIDNASLRADLSNTSDTAQGDNFIGVKQPYIGSVARTQHSVNAQYVSILDWLGDGYSSSLDASSGFSSAVVNAPSGKHILVPSGTYTLTSDVTATGRVFIFEEPVTLNGTGRLNGALVHRYKQDGSISFGVGGIAQYASKYRFGGTNHGPIGLQIGGGESLSGEEGNVLFPDGYGGWSVAQPSRYGSAVEMAFQPSDIVGVMTTVPGTAFIDSVSGEPFHTDMIDRRIYFSGFTYKVKSYISSTRVELKNVNDSAVVFATATSYEWQMVGAITTSQVTISGTSVTRISGEPFVPMTNTEYFMRLGSERIVVTAVSTPDTLTLFSAPSLQGIQTVTFYTSVDDLAAAVRVHKSTGFSHEENVTLAAYASGKYQLHAGSSGTTPYPLIIGCQWNAMDGEERSQITLNPNGDTLLGGKNSGILTVPYNESPSAAGVSIVGNDVGEVFIGGKGLASDIDVYLAPKGAGLVGFGQFTASVGTVAGYITIKDGHGNLRKLAVLS